MKQLDQADAVPLQPLHVIRNLLLGVALFLVLEASIFRTPFYSAYLSPSSFAGRVQRRLQEIKQSHPEGQREIVLLGDSRMCEGFSARLADSLYDGRAVKFLNAAVPGMRLRPQYYLLRELDPTAERFAVVVIPLETYNDRHAWDLADNTLDLHFVPSLLRYRDALEFPWTFKSAQNRTDSLLDCLLKGFAFKEDLYDFLTAPRKRKSEVMQQRQLAAIPADYQHTGVPLSLKGLTYDHATNLLQLPPWFTNDQKRDMNALFEHFRAQPVPVTEYQKEWLGKIFKHYEKSATRFVFLQLPRGPFIPDQDDAPPNHATVAWLNQQRKVTVLDAQSFTFLERPECFSDRLHLNVLGRRGFTVQLTHELAKAAGAAPVALGRGDSNAGQDWIPTAPHRQTLALEQIIARPDRADGFYAPTPAPSAVAYPPWEGPMSYAQTSGWSYVQPKFWFALPLIRTIGIARIHGALPVAFASLLPLTVTATAPDGKPISVVLHETGPFEIEVPCSLPSGDVQADRIVVQSDKSLVPRASQIGEDERALAFAVVKIEYWENLGWEEKRPGQWCLHLLDAMTLKMHAAGFQPRFQEMNWVDPECWFALPPQHQAGVVKLHGQLPENFVQLLPLTVTVIAPGETRQVVVRHTGPITIEVPCAPVGNNEDRVVLRVDKTLLPKECHLGADERRLSLAVERIEFMERGK